MVVPGTGAGAGSWVICPGARIAGLGGPWGRMKRKKTKNIESAALMAMRLVICRLAILSKEANVQDVVG